MKTVVIFALVFVVLQIEAKSFDRFKRGVDDADATWCVDDLKLDKDKIFEISNRDYAPEDDQDYNKFMECYWKKKGYFKQDGPVNYNALSQMITDIFEEDFSPDFSKLVADSSLTACRDISSNSDGLTAVQVETCILRNLNKLFEN